MLFRENFLRKIIKFHKIIYNYFHFNYIIIKKFFIYQNFIKYLPHFLRLSNFFLHYYIYL
jgi:hypothetical protein